jgi:hypothetical protein
MRPSSINYGVGAVVVQQSIYEESLTMKHRLGERLALGERTFYYAHAGEALIAGQAIESAAVGGADTTLQNTCAVTVAANIGDFKVYANALTTAQVADLYAEGWMAIWDATTAGISYLYRIKSNSAIATTGVTSYYTLYDPLHIALTTSDQVNVVTNLFKDVVQSHTAHVGMVLGVAPIAITSGYYFWLQTYGPAAVHTVAALDLADSVTASDDTAGTWGKSASNTLVNPMGYCIHFGTAGEAGIAFLTIAR